MLDNSRVYRYLIDSGLIHDMEKYSKIVITATADTIPWDETSKYYYYKGRTDEYYKDKLFLQGGVGSRCDKEYKKGDIVLEKTNIPYDDQDDFTKDFYNNKDIIQMAIKDYGITEDKIEEYYMINEVMKTNHPKKDEFFDCCSKIEKTRKELEELKKQILAKEEELDVLKSKRYDIDFEICYGMTKEEFREKSRH